jgi:putative flavoprotein involved in K+ transport
MNHIEVLVIGAGQAGLAAGYHLRKAGIDFLIVDGAERIGDSWRRRYKSLTLFTPRQFSTLPGLEMSGNREMYPTRDEFADYLESYAAAFALPVRLGARIVRLSKRQDSRFEALLDGGETIVADRVIMATGGFQIPVVPTVAKGFDPSVLQLTAESYSEPSQVPAGAVLVVGDGASGRDIAAELAPLRTTFLAIGKPRRLFPERILGKSVWWWLNWTGVLRASPDSIVGRRVREADAFPDRGRSVVSLMGMGVRVVPRLTKASGSLASFEDGATAEIAAVIWAVGYRDDSDWIDIAAAKHSQGAFLHESGVSPVEGLYFVGRPWQRNRASALVMGASPDAAQIVVQLIANPRVGGRTTKNRRS